MKQKYFDNIYDKSRQKGFSPEDSYKIAKSSTDNLVVGKKSFALNSADISGDRMLDVLVGYPGLDTEAQFGGRRLSDDGWLNPPKTSLTADINHYLFDVTAGVRNDLDEKWQNFSAKVQDWYVSDDGLRAKVFVPESELGDEFINDYKQGKYGVSVEYVGSEQDNVIYDWEITGVSFHTDPSYTKTKNG